eukprot:TRINITY_DN4525_c0_g1_i2.p1 TRINITY_DN4525_c0_g1~~TRINITY_DN4525_c0_g1_i2.p1  ORF type:complete len:313 (-),score=56.22 TRINITY_DN4525_c0_g1_i2:10-900(-)
MCIRDRYNDVLQMYTSDCRCFLVKDWVVEALFPLVKNRARYLYLLERNETSDILGVQRDGATLFIPSIDYGVTQAFYKVSTYLSLRQKFSLKEDQLQTESHVFDEIASRQTQPSQDMVKYDLSQELASISFSDELRKIREQSLKIEHKKKLNYSPKQNIDQSQILNVVYDFHRSAIIQITRAFIKSRELSSAKPEGPMNLCVIGSRLSSHRYACERLAKTLRANQFEVEFQEDFSVKKFEDKQSLESLIDLIAETPNFRHLLVDISPSTIVQSILRCEKSSLGLYHRFEKELDQYT